MDRSRSRRNQRNAPILRLPTKRDVADFREKRLLLHLYEQLGEQIQEDPADWQLHFQMANLLAFSDDYAYHKDPAVDAAKAEEHYQEALQLLHQLHSEHYAEFQQQQQKRREQQRIMSMRSQSPTYDDEVETPAPTNTPVPSSPNTLILITAPPSANSGSGTESELEDDAPTPRKRRKRKRRKRRQRSPGHERGEAKGKGKRPMVLFVKQKSTKRTRPSPTVKRSLLIKVLTHEEEVAQEIECRYSCALSEEEQQAKQPRRRQVSCKIDIKRIAAKYLNAVTEANAPRKSKKRPSIIQMLNTDDTYSPSTPQRNRGSLSLVQSHCEQLAGADADDAEYTVPGEIAKGFTQCFFGYGKWMCLRERVLEGVGILLDCCSWYADSFVDPSCLTSLILPPQFLFQNSVKKTNCVSFRTLTKYISKLCADEQKRLDRRFKSLKMPKYIREYAEYLRVYEEQREQEELDMPTAVLEAYDTGSTGSTRLSRNGSSSSDDSGAELQLSNAWSNVSSIKVPGLTHLDSMASVQSVATECGITPLSCATPSVQDYGDVLVTPTPTAQRDRKDCLDYAVYPEDVQALIADYTALCARYHRLGVVLADHLRHADAKREYSKAIKVFRKLKIKPALYEDVLAEIRKQQRNSFTATTGKERAQKLALQQKSPSSRGNHRPNSPSASFSFSFADTTQEMTISPYLLATAQ